MEIGNENGRNVIVDYISYWEEGEVNTSASLDLLSGIVSNIEMAGYGEEYETLIEECIGYKGEFYTVEEKEDGDYIIEEASMEDFFKHNDVFKISNSLDNSITVLSGIDELKAYILKLTEEESEEEEKECIEAISKEDIDKEELFARCSQILKKRTIRLESIIFYNGDTIGVEIEELLTIPNSEYDNDQILCRMGRDMVSSFNITRNGKNIAHYGSRICGEQRAFYETDDLGNILPFGMGVTAPIGNNDKGDLLFHKVWEKHINKEEGEEYLHLVDQSWLEYTFYTQQGEDLSECSEQLQADAEWVHGSIKEGMFLHINTIKEILSVVSLVEQGECSLSSIKSTSVQEA